MTQVHKSRWGYHPCDYQTFQLLKWLNGQYQKALRGYAAWKRWSRKQPQNRVIRRRLVDAQGRLVGREVVGPRPEPPLCQLFCRREPVVSHRSADGPCVREDVRIERVTMTHEDLPAAYRAARTPWASPGLVPPRVYSAEAIRELAALAEVWYGPAPRGGS
jgi:hypothetical protein